MRNFFVKGEFKNNRGFAEGKTKKGAISFRFSVEWLDKDVYLIVKIKLFGVVVINRKWYINI